MADEQASAAITKSNKPVHAGATVRKELFCAACQAHTPHTFGRDFNNEIVALCDCGRFVKFPMTDDLNQLNDWIERHHQHNKGQVTVEMAEKEQAAHDERFKKLMGIS